MKENNEENKRLDAYQYLIKKAVEKRAENISVSELANKLNIKTSGLYRMERGNQDMKLSTMISYLQAFGYRLEIVPDKLEVVPNGRKTKPDYSRMIEELKAPSARRQRLKLLKYLISLEEASLTDEE